MTLCDHALKYRFPIGRPGIMTPATIFMSEFVAMPFPKREYSIVLWDCQLQQLAVTHKGRDDDAEDECDDECPHGEVDVLLRDDHNTKHKGDDERGDVPPPWRLLVLCHRGVVRVLIRPVAEVLDAIDNVLAPEEDAVRDDCANLGWLVAASRSELTAAFPTIIAQVYVPARYGSPYAASLVLSRTPLTNTLVDLYRAPSAVRSCVERNGCDFAPHALP